MFLSDFTSLTLLTYFFFLHQWPFTSLCTVFDSISCNIDEVLSINPSALCLSLETLTSIMRTGLPILLELIDLVNSVIIFLSQTNLFRWLTFLLGSHTVILTVLLFWIYFFLLTLLVVLQWLSLLLEILILFLSQFPLTFHHIHNGMPRFTADWDSLRDHLRDVPWQDISKLSASADASEFCEWVQMYISLIRSSLTHLHGFQLLVLLP